MKSKNFFQDLKIPESRVCGSVMDKYWPIISTWRYKWQKQGSKLIFGALKLSTLTVICIALGVVYKTEIVPKILASAGFAKIEKIEYVGQSRLTVKELAAHSGIAPFSSLFAVEKDEVISNLKKLAWVRDVEVTKNWFNELEIKVTENIPIALIFDASNEGKLQYVNKHGKSFATPHDLDSLDYPVITGSGKLKDDVLLEQAIKDSITFLNKAAQNNENLPLQAISEIHIDEKGELVIYLVEHSFPIYVGKREIEKAYVYLVRVLRDMYGNSSRSKRIEKIGYIQLDYIKDQVLVVDNGAN